MNGIRNKKDGRELFEKISRINILDLRQGEIKMSYIHYYPDTGTLIIGYGIENDYVKVYMKPILSEEYEKQINDGVQAEDTFSSDKITLSKEAIYSGGATWITYEKIYTPNSTVTVLYNDEYVFSNEDCDIHGHNYGAVRDCIMSCKEWDITEWYGLELYCDECMVKISQHLTDHH